MRWQKLQHAVAVSALAAAGSWACTGPIERADSGAGASPGSGASATGAGAGGSPGVGGSGPGGTAGGPPEIACTDPDAIHDPGPAYSHRLTRTEYDNTIAVILQDDTRPASRFAYSEELNHNFDNNPATLTAPPLLIEDYKDAAETLAADAVTRLDQLLPCDAADGASCAEQFIVSFGERAFRRPVTDEDVARYRAPFDVGAAVSFENGIRLVIYAMLQSADFLYRIELGAEPVAPGVVKLSSWEMASRLSYFLWNTTPDQVLTDAARADALTTPEQVAEQAQRMLADDRARATVADFHDQWLDLRRVPSLVKDQVVFPSYTQAVAQDMHTEAMLFIDDVLFSGSGNTMNLFTATHSFVNANLSAFYGLGSAGTDTFAHVDMLGQERAGLLTLGAMMALEAKPNQADPIQRGKLVRNQLLCDPPDPPPPGLIVTPPKLDEAMTTRERFAAHRSSVACEGCHRLLDPIGFIFENYDGAGRYRTEENGTAIDNSGEVVDTDIAGPIVGATALGQALAGSSQVQRCVATNWFRYAAGREETTADACSLETLQTRFAGSEFNIQELLTALTQTDAFLYRRGGGS